MDQGDDTLTKGRELVKKARGHLDDLLSSPAFGPMQRAFLFSASAVSEASEVSGLARTISAATALKAECALKTLAKMSDFQAEYEGSICSIDEGRLRSTYRVCPEQVRIKAHAGEANRTTTGRTAAWSGRV